MTRECRWCGRTFDVPASRARALSCSALCGKAWSRYADDGSQLMCAVPVEEGPRAVENPQCEWCLAGPLPNNRKYCSEWCAERVRGRRVDASGVWFVRCEGCGGLFAGRTERAKYCSRRCRKRARDDRWPVTPKKRQRVYERDGFKCQICNRRVDPDDFEMVVGSDGREALVCGPRYPTIDHKIPQETWNGPHEMWNLRTAHMACNSNRGHDMRGVGWWGPDGDKATAWMIENGWIKEVAA